MPEIVRNSLIGLCVVTFFLSALSVQWYLEIRRCRLLNQRWVLRPRWQQYFILTWQRLCVLVFAILALTAVLTAIAGAQGWYESTAFVLGTCAGWAYHQGRKRL